MMTPNKVTILLFALSFTAPSFATTYKRFWFKNNSNIEINVMYRGERCMSSRSGPLTAQGGLQLSPGQESYADVKTVDGYRCNPSNVMFAVSELMANPPNGQMPTTFAAFNVGAGNAWLITPDQAKKWNFPSAESVRYGYSGPIGSNSPYDYDYQLFWSSLYADYRAGSGDLEIDFNRPFH